eukprot:scaffold2038_cov259-Pinguiococcus_pyrenoidosus.AAC.4
MPPAVLVLGGASYLAQFLLQELTSPAAELEAWEVHFTFRNSVVVVPQATGHRVDLTDAGAVASLLRSLNPSVVVNCAAMTSIGECEKNPQEALRANVLTGVFEALRDQDGSALLLQLSTDQVYDGTDAPYEETSLANPVNHYGRTKLLCEDTIASEGLRAVILRSSNILGPPAPYTQQGKFLQWLDGALAQASAGFREGAHGNKDEAPVPERVTLWEDEFRNFVWVTDICHVVKTAVLKEAAGVSTELNPAEGMQIFNMGGPQRLSRVDVGRILCEARGYAPDAIQPVCRYENGEQKNAGPRNPQDISMISDKLLQACGVEAFTTLQAGLSSSADALRWRRATRDAVMGPSGSGEGAGQPG